MKRDNYQEFMARFAPAERGRPVIEIDLDATDEPLTPFIVVKHNGNTVVLNPMPLNDHLCVDAHPFKDGEAATAGVFGMTNGGRYSLPETGTTSHRWNSAAMVALLIGEQSDAANVSFD